MTESNSITLSRLGHRYDPWSSVEIDTSQDSTDVDSKATAIHLRNSQQSESVMVNFERVVLFYRDTFSTLIFGGVSRRKDFADVVLSLSHSGVLEAPHQLLFPFRHLDGSNVPNESSIHYSSLAVPAAHYPIQNVPYLVVAEQNCTSAILETLEGFVEHMDCETAHIIFRDASGRKLSGQCPAAEMRSNGIEEGQRFICRTIQTGSDVRIDIEAIPLNELTNQEWDKLRRSVDEVFTEDSESND